jgi:hypothetical protein
MEIVTQKALAKGLIGIIGKFAWSAKLVECCVQKARERGIRELFADARLLIHMSRQYQVAKAGAELGPDPWSSEFGQVVQFVNIPQVKVSGTLIGR